VEVIERSVLDEMPVPVLKRGAVERDAESRRIGGSLMVYSGASLGRDLGCAGRAECG
jgi:hypothetical protein